jgi:hypothetical protein
MNEKCQNFFLLIIPIVLNFIIAHPSSGCDLTSFDPDRHRAALIMAVDDWVHGPFLDSAEVIDVPVTWFIDPTENDGTGVEAARRALLVAANDLGHEIAAHTVQGITSATTQDQARQIFSTSKAWIQNLIDVEPVSWTYYGNDWNLASQSVVREFFPGVVRLRINSSDSNPVYAYRGIAQAYPTMPIGLPMIGNVPFPLAQYRLDQMVYTSRICNTCTDTISDDDTTGTQDFLNDLVKIRGVAITSVHPGGDISSRQFAHVLRSAKSRGDIWICTARQFYMEFGSLLQDGDRRNIHVSQHGREFATGAIDDPVTLNNVLYCWNKSVQLEDEEYDLESIFGPEQDLVITTNISLRGPATLTADLSGHGTTATNIKIQMLPVGQNYFNFRGGIKNMTINVINCDNSGSQIDIGVNLLASNADIDSCTFRGGGSQESAFIYGSSVNLDQVRIRWNRFELDGAGTCAAIQRGSGLGMDGWCIAQNEFVCDAPGTKYGVFFVNQPSDNDTIINNRYINSIESTTYYGVRLMQSNNSTSPYYNLRFNGSQFSGHPTKIWLRSGVKTLNGETDSNLDSLCASSIVDWSRKMYCAETIEIDNDTRFGGVPLPWLGGNAWWSSIGCTQFGGDGITLVPPDVHIECDVNGNIRLTWDPVGPLGEVVYRVRKSTCSHTEAVDLQAEVLELDWQDPVLPIASEMYYYTVTAEYCQ